MFERFTDRARRVVVLAQEEARMLNHDYVGTEHILLALIGEGGGVAAQALESLGITEEAARHQVEEIAGPGQTGPQRGHLPLTPRAKKTLQLSMREAIALGHGYIGTEHILLGLIREDDGVAIRVLNGLGVDPNSVRQQVIRQVSARRVPEEPGTGRAAGRRKRKQLSELRGAIVKTCGLVIFFLRRWLVDWSRVAAAEGYDRSSNVSLMSWPSRSAPSCAGSLPG